MSNNYKSNKKPKFYLMLIFWFIVADIICDNYSFGLFDKQKHVNELYLFLGLALLQIFASPIQAAFSDYYCRKKSLIFSLTASLVALFFVFLYNQKIIPYFYIIILILIIKGAFGNTIPLAWAAIADTQEKNVRFSFGVSTASYAIGYLLLIVANMYLLDYQSNLISMLFIVFLIYFCVTKFFDVRDKNEMNRKEISIYRQHPVLVIIGLVLDEIHLIFNDLKNKHKRSAFIAFMLWEISLYSILLLYVDFNVNEFSKIAIGMMFGYLTGVFCLKFLQRINDYVLIKVGYYLSGISLLPFFIIFPFMEKSNYWLLTICYFFHTMGNAFLCPTLFSMLSKETKPHEQGRLYGLVESVDTIAFLFASIAVILYNHFQLDLVVIIIFSFVTVAVSWFPYANFEKSEIER